MEKGLEKVIIDDRFDGKLTELECLNNNQSIKIESPGELDLLNSFNKNEFKETDDNSP